MCKFISTGLVLISALFINTSAIASPDCENLGVNMQNLLEETVLVTKTNCNSDGKGSDWRNNDLTNTEIPDSNSWNQLTTCILANCRSRLKTPPLHTSARLTTP